MYFSGRNDRNLVMIHWNETLERAEDDTRILSKVTG